MSDDAFSWWILPFALAFAIVAVICAIYLPPESGSDAACRRVIRKWAKDKGWKILKLTYDPLDHAVISGPPYYMVHLEFEDGKDEWALVVAKSSGVEVRSWGKPLIS